MRRIQWNLKLAGPASLALLLALQTALTAGEATDDMTATVMKADPIKFRNAKSHTIHAGLQKPDEDGEGGPIVHVYMTFSNHAYPYVMSLGDFVVIKTKEGEVKVVDEFGEKIPLPYRQPERVGFHKGDLLALKSFDLSQEGKYRDAIKAIDQAINLAPNSYRLHNNRGVLLILMGRPQAEAQKEFGIAIKLNAKCAAAYSNRAWLSIAMNKPSLAVDDANQALKIEPNLKPANQCLVRSDLEEGNEEKAAARMENSGLARKNDAQSLKLQAETLIANKDYKGARLVLRKLMTVSTNDADAVLQLAYVMDMEGDLDEAIARARQAVTMQPENPGVREILGRYLEKNRDYPAAALQYEAALDLLNEWVPKDRQKKALAIEGSLLRSVMAMNDFKRAETWTKYFTKQFPSSPTAHYNRAWLLSQGAEDYYIKEAVQEYDMALKLDPGLKQTHYNLALLSMKTGNKKRAEEELKMFIEQAPDDPDHESAKSMLAKLQAQK